MTSFRLLPGLPPYGQLARAFPAEWSKLGREGMVVEFVRSDKQTWVGNFAPGISSLSAVLPHPDGRQVLVFSGGNAWAIDTDAETGEQVLQAVDAVWPVVRSDDLILSRQGIALVRLGPAGILWHTHRLSWDGFDRVHVDSGRISGLAWDAINDRWLPFDVDVATGSSVGGSYGSEDTEGWERLAPVAVPPNER